MRDIARFSLRASRGKKSRANSGGRVLPALRALTALLGGLYLGWLLLFPLRSGSFGLWLSSGLLNLLGSSAALTPLLILGGLVRKITLGEDRGALPMSAASLLLLACAAGGLDIASGVLSWPQAPGGGAVGALLGRVLSSALGGFFGFTICGAGVLFSLSMLWDIHWGRLLSSAVRALADDMRHWQRSKAELALRREAAIAVSPAPAAPAVPAAPLQPQPAAVLNPATEPTRLSRTQTAPATTGRRGEYKPPSTSLLTAPPPERDRGRPSEEEVGAAAANLEKTLLSFNVAAKVSGYSPGPVITRYELAPAPGVKVSSIVALQPDLALALKARGIRIIAPIPGKAAVGIEIPNNRPASVVLREILESGAFPPQAGPLSFAIGLTADGNPLVADLQKMPHLLVAGATNSGKSVLIHSLILSILLRARPDEVKFLLIDPKRLELTFYERIPHLFDPLTPAEKAAVVTTPKEAAKSLSSMVKLMEKRYEKFQRYGVRNIDSYNVEADARGEPREYFIVVVIDELADLVLVAQESVEDSIQRLAQMARAVGIHLVLATQRPSVDVITGVIKANLPCRIALQVITKIDSKVILDSSGAESLQGKGDLLFLASGAQKAERGQGAYVGEDEIRRVVEALRRNGGPSYETLESSAPSHLESDLKTFGVEPQEFAAALRLVLERRRVSQDLLKSQFGSSARATNILSLLEVKSLIHKPEGSNRWEIHFDQIENALKSHFPGTPWNENPDSPQN